ncbi:MAG TPA: SH3 domain-containing protein, partial [Pseudorhizobium sp.]|nr:SH3 domain-containing protein [Pseudorhizobium sp.]
MKSNLNAMLAAAALAAVAVPAQAQMSTVTASDITVRSGPGEEYPEIGLATRGSQAVMDGCLAGSSWCRIDVNGMRGWVFAQYLTIQH